jgi:hypothetical protein
MVQVDLTYGLDFISNLYISVIFLEEIINFYILYSIISLFVLKGHYFQIAVNVPSNKMNRIQRDNECLIQVVLLLYLEFKGNEFGKITSIPPISGLSISLIKRLSQKFKSRDVSNLIFLKCKLVSASRLLTESISLFKVSILFCIALRNLLDLLLSEFQLSPSWPSPLLLA